MSGARLGVGEDEGRQWPFLKAKVLQKTEYRLL